jgi:K+-sensing histidine kinase KdpD
MTGVGVPRAGEFNALAEVAKSLVAPLELPDLLDEVMQTIVRSLEQADIGAIMLWDQPSGVFRPTAAFGYDLDVLREIGLRAGESITGKAFDNRQVLLFSSPDEVNQAMADMRPFNRRVMSRSIGSDTVPLAAVAAPVTAGDNRYGVLVIEALRPHRQFSREDLSFVQMLADLVALAIDRDRLRARADAVREARRAEHMRSEVMATLSHELRMPLATIKGYTSALLMDEFAWSDEKGKEFLGLIEEACDDMEGMLQDILDSSLIEVDQLNLQPEPIRLPPLVREVSAEVQHRSAAHHLVVDFPADFPIVEADPRWTKQVFRNILDNAVKYSPQGGLVVIKGEARTSDVVVSVADQGIGMSSEDVIPLFEKYFRVQAVASLRIPGTGLGLPIARALVEAQGGRIWVESKVGEGTTVFFSLARAQSREEAK